MKINYPAAAVLEQLMAAMIRRVFTAIATDIKIGSNLSPADQEVLRIIRQGLYQAVVRQGIAALEI